jgi:hypothetical protein
MTNSIVGDQLDPSALKSCIDRITLLDFFNSFQLNDESLPLLPTDTDAFDQYLSKLKHILSGDPVPSSVVAHAIGKLPLPIRIS